MSRGIRHRRRRALGRWWSCGARVRASRILRAWTAGRQWACCPNPGGARGGGSGGGGRGRWGAVWGVAPVSVEIGGLPAAVLYAGAAPGNIPGLFQINARISQDVTPGDGVPVRVKVGNLMSQQGVTVAVR